MSVRGRRRNKTEKGSQEWRPSNLVDDRVIFQRYCWKRRSQSHFYSPMEESEKRKELAATARRAGGRMDRRRGGRSEWQDGLRRQGKEGAVRRSLCVGETWGQKGNVSRYHLPIQSRFEIGIWTEGRKKEEIGFSCIQDSKELAFSWAQQNAARLTFNILTHLCRTLQGNSFQSIPIARNTT